MTGQLTPVPGPPVTLARPDALLGDPVRRSLFVTANGRLNRLDIDPASGVLTLPPPVTGPGVLEFGMALHPRLPVLYVIDAGSDRIRVFHIHQPCCVLLIGQATIGSNSRGIVVHPSGRFVYATTSLDFIGTDTSHLWGFAIDQVSGLLTPLVGSPWLEGSAKGTEDVAIEPGGRYLYAVNRIANEITCYLIDGTTGQLQRHADAPFPTEGLLPEHLAITNSGRFLYATNIVSNTVSGFQIAADGRLAPVPNSPFGSGDPRGLAIGGHDRFVYVASEGTSSILIHAIDPGTGALVLLPGPAAAAAVPRNIATVRVALEIQPPTLTIGDAAVIEGDAGFASAEFTVRLSNPAAAVVTVGFATSPGTAQAPSDYSSASGTLTFMPGTDVLPVSVPVAGDVMDEPDEFFSLALSSPLGAGLEDAEGFARIRDDDGGTILLATLERNTDLVTSLEAQPGPVADEDLYLLIREPWSSHEIVVDGASGDLGDAGPLLELVSGDFSIIVPSTPVGAGFARALRLSNELPVPRLDYVRVRSAGCSTDCGPDDTYRIRLRDTTGIVPRFNESGGQVTVLVLQNRSETALTAHVSYWGTDGARVAGTTVALSPRAATTVPTPPLAQGTSGSITISHDGALDALSGKAVAVDPASGFSFDTPLTTRPR